MKMASVEHKRRHVMTQRMAEYLRMRQHPYEGDDGNGPRLLHCPRPFCDKVLTSSAGLRYHIKAHDTTEGMYRCIRCAKHFKSYNGLRYHTQKSKCETNSSSEEENSSEESPQKTYVAECSWYTTPVENDLMFSNLNCKAEQTEASWSDTEADFVQQNVSPKSEDEGCAQHDNWLRELAIIATGPQSPLLQPEVPAQSLTTRRATWPSSSVRPTLSLESSLHSYARPPPRSRTPSPPPSPVKTENHCLCNKNGDKLHLGSHTINPVWLIFLRGTRLRFLSGEDVSWFDIEEWPHKLPLGLAELGHNGLQVTELRELTPCSSDDMVDIEEDIVDSIIQLTLKTLQPKSVCIQVQCSKHHPFFVKEKGWCSFAQEQTEQLYELTYCEVLEVNDVCLPPNHPDAACTLEMLDSLRSHHFTAMDSSAVLALSNMAKKKELCLSPPRVTSQSRKVSKKDPNKAKRPMNAFMLFAKRFRMEYMRRYPGKDNRAISVLLGDHWKKLTNEERRAYTQEAKLLADQQKRLHPDCWKRKRSVSTSVLER